MKQWVYTFTISEQRVGQSVKAVLIDWLIPQRFRGALRIKKHIQVNGLVVPTSYILQLNDQLTLIFDEEDCRTGNSHYVSNPQQTVEIVIETESFVVVDKPAGMKMHPHSPDEDDTLLNFLAAEFENNKHMSAGMLAQPYMVHRIDRDTSGAVIIAKNPVIVPILNRMLKEKSITRTYLTWVSGTFEKDEGVIDTPIGINPDQPYQRMTHGLEEQNAKTHWYKVHTVYQNTLLRVQLETGRMHQIRVHLASIGHPIIVDVLYGTSGNQRMMLHSSIVELKLPFDGPNKLISSKVPSDFPRQLKA